MENITSKLLEERSCIVKITAFVLLLFGVNIYLSYATDSYCTLTNGFHGSAIDMATRNGRPIIGLIYELHYLSGLSNISFYYISSALALVFLGVSVWIYQEILKKYEIKENIRILLAFAAIANIFIIEYFMFIEKCGFMLAILFDVIAVYWIDKFFSERRMSYYFFTVLAMILAIFTYQGTIAIFVILSITFAMKQAKSFKQYIINGLSIGVAYVIPVIIDLVAFKFIFKSSRIAEKPDYISTLKNVILGTITNGEQTFNILPKYFFLISAFVVFSALIVSAITSRRSVWRIFNALIIIMASCIFSTATILQGSGWWATRTVYPIASMVAALAIDIFVNEDGIPQNKLIQRFTHAVSILVVSILVIFQYLSFNKIYIDKYQINALDQYRYQYIYQAICDYQEETGTEIKKIAVYDDAERSWPQYSNLYCTGDLVVSAFSTDWSDVTALNYYMQTSYEKVSRVEKYEKYFSGKNWYHLSNDQLIFDGDTLHLCVY